MHTRRRRLRTHKLAATLVALIIITGLGGGGDLTYVTLKSHVDQLQASLTLSLQAGQAQLESGKTLLQQANSNHDTKLVAQAITHFAAAKTDFQSAGQQADDSRFLHYLEYVPAVGQLARSRHTAIDGIARMGAALSDAGRDVATLDGEIIKPASTGEAGRTLLTVLSTVSAGLVTVKADLQAAQKAAGQVDVSVVPARQQATFLKARASIDSALGGFTEFERLVPVLTDVLGGNGARTYLIEQANPAELRAGGGFIGTYSLLHADHGSLTVVRSGDAYDLVNPRPLPGQPGFIPQPTPYREIIPDTSWSFVDSNIYPDFQSNALAAENFVQPRIGHVDGVLSMDYYTVSQMLALTGPVSVPGYGTTVDSTNFVPTAMQHDIAGDMAHKAILSALSGPLMQRIAAMPPNLWPTLLATFNTLAAQHHLQAFFNMGAVEAEIDRIGWSGRVHAEQMEFVMEVESNYFGNKANYFITRHYALALSRAGNTLRHELAVSLINSEPCGAEDRTLYKGNVRLYIPAVAFAASDNLQAVRYANPAAPAGAQMLDGWLFVTCGGGRGQALFDYDTPWNGLKSTKEELYWQKQPGTLTDTVDVTYSDGIRKFSAKADLSQDLVVTISSNGLYITLAQVTQATIPSLNL